MREMKTELISEIENDKQKLLQKKLQLIEEMILSGELIIYDTVNDVTFDAEDYANWTPICFSGPSIQLNIGLIRNEE